MRGIRAVEENVGCVVAQRIVVADHVALFVAIRSVDVLDRRAHLQVRADRGGERGVGHVGAEVKDIGVGGFFLWRAGNVSIFYLLHRPGLVIHHQWCKICNV